MTTMSLKRRGLLTVCIALSGCTVIADLDNEYIFEGVNASGSGSSGLCEPDSVTACYSGPLDTNGNGVCVAGSQKCSPDGSGWGECIGEVLPSIENCATVLDESCDGKVACTGGHVLSKSFGDQDEQLAYAIGVDHAGDILLGGTFLSSIDFGGGALLSQGQSDIFIAKLGANLGYHWSKRFGDAVDQQLQALDVDMMNNIVITGYFDGVIDFGDKKLATAGLYDTFIAKLDADGNHVWSQSFGDASGQYGTAIAIDAVDDIVLAGNVEGSISFGMSTHSSKGASDIFVAKFNSQGDVLWSKSFGDSADQFVADVATNADRDIYVTGNMSGSIDFGGPTIVSSGVSNTFVAKLDRDGNHIWSKCFGGDGVQESTGIAVGAGGEVALVGNFTNNVVFEMGSERLSEGLSDIYVVRYHNDGTLAWNVRFGDTGAQNVYSVSMDGADNTVLTGGFLGSVDFGNAMPHLSAGAADIFVAKLNVSGSHVWSHHFGDNKDQFGRDVAVDRLGNVFLAGDFYGAVSFGGSPLESTTSTDVFVTKLLP